MTYRIDHIPHTQVNQRPGLTLEPTTLTVHSTGNPTSTARNERDNLARPGNKRQASFHVVVDEREAIECLPFDEVAWHAGDARGNRTSLSIEICESGDREKTLRHAAKVCAAILDTNGWDTSRMCQHHDWSGKNCPRILRDTGRWEEFVGMVEDELYDPAGILAAAGLINSPDYWRQVLNGKLTPSPENLRALLSKWAGSLEVSADE